MRLLRALRAAIAAQLGRDELVLLAALGLIVFALWPSVGRLALLPVGAVLLFVTLPTRRRFIERIPPETSGRRP